MMLAKKLLINNQSMNLNHSGFVESCHCAHLTIKTGLLKCVCVNTIGDIAGGSQSKNSPLPFEENDLFNLIFTLCLSSHNSSALGLGITSVEKLE